MKKILFTFFCIILGLFSFSCTSMKLYVEDTDCTGEEKIISSNGWFGKKEYTLKNYRLLSRGKDQTTDSEGLLISGSGQYTTTHILSAQIFKDDQKIMDTRYIQTIDTEQKEIIIQIKKDLFRNFIQIGLDNPIEINEIIDFQNDLYLNNFLSTPNLTLKIVPLTHYITEDGKIYDFKEVIGAQFFVNNQDFAIMNCFITKEEFSFNNEVLNSLTEEQKDYLYAFLLNFYILYNNNKSYDKKSRTTISPRDNKDNSFLKFF